MTERYDVIDFNDLYTKTIQLEKRMELLEKEFYKKEEDEVTWALSQFRYRAKNNDERKALEIIEKVLGKRKKYVKK